MFTFQYQKEVVAKAAGLQFVSATELQAEYRHRQSTTDEDDDDEDDEENDEEDDESEYDYDEEVKFSLMRNW